MRAANGRRFVAEGQWYGGFPERTPPPFTTIARRLCHVGSGLAKRANHHLGDRSLTWENFWERVEVPGSAEAGMAFVDRWYAEWRDGILAKPEAFSETPSNGPPGSVDGRFPFADVILHVNAELIQVGGEVAPLRDLYQARQRRP